MNVFKFLTKDRQEYLLNMIRADHTDARMHRDLAQAEARRHHEAIEAGNAGLKFKLDDHIKWVADQTDAELAVLQSIDNRLKELVAHKKAKKLTK